MWSRLPVSLLGFVWTGLLIVPQLFPVPGLFLMYLGAPFWPVITLNGAFLGLAVEAISRPSVSRWWLAAPVLWFGGYQMAVLWEGAALRDLSQAMAQQNTPRIAFDAGRSDLVVVGEAGPAREISADYDLPVVYSRDPFETGAFRIVAQGRCATIATQRPGLVAAGATDVRDISQSWAYEVTRQGGGRSESLRWNDAFFCQAFTPETPRRPQVHVAETTATELLGAAEIHTVTVDDGRDRAAYRWGEAHPLNPFPTPVIGCGLMESSWRCVAQFWRGHRQICRDYEDRSSVIAGAMLGLRKRPAEGGPPGRGVPTLPRCVSPMLSHARDQ